MLLAFREGYLKNTFVSNPTDISAFPLYFLSSRPPFIMSVCPILKIFKNSENTNDRRYFHYLYIMLVVNYASGKMIERRTLKTY